MKTKRLKLTYSEEFKRAGVEEIDSGVMTIPQGPHPKPETRSHFYLTDN